MKDLLVCWVAFTITMFTAEVLIKSIKPDPIHWDAENFDRLNIEQCGNYVPSWAKPKWFGPCEVEEPTSVRKLLTRDTL